MIETHFISPQKATTGKPSPWLGPTISRILLMDDSVIIESYAHAKTLLRVLEDSFVIGILYSNVTPLTDDVIISCF